MAHTIEELQYRQALPLKLKIAMTKTRIREWVNHYGQDSVAVSFSGGKDSTVLLHLVREEFPDIPAVYFDTGLEYPEIREFVKSFENVIWMKPKMNFRDVISKHGYPMISKEVSEVVYSARNYLARIVKMVDEEEATDIIVTDRQTDRQTTNAMRFRRLLGLGEFSRENEGGGYRGQFKNCSEKESFQRTRRISQAVSAEAAEKVYQWCLGRGLIKESRESLQTPPWRLAAIMGEAVIPQKEGIFSKEGAKSPFNCERHIYFLDAPFEIGSACCGIMKKSLAHRLAKDGVYNMTAQMASESRLRTQQWLRNGCNGFELKNPVSNPMSFWFEQDVLAYIKMHDLPIASVYGDIVEEGELPGQMTWDQFTDIDLAGMFDLERPLLRTTGCQRTGCVFCGFGCHLEKKPGRWENIARVSNPALLDFCMRGGAFDSDGLWKPDNRGLGYWFVLKWINIHGRWNINIPNFEEYEAKYGTEDTKEWLYGDRVWNYRGGWTRNAFHFPPNEVQ